MELNRDVRARPRATKVERTSEGERTTGRRGKRRGGGGDRGKGVARATAVAEDAIDGGGGATFERSSSTDRRFFIKIRWPALLGHCS